MTIRKLLTVTFEIQEPLASVPWWTLVLENAHCQHEGA